MVAIIFAAMGAVLVVGGLALAFKADSIFGMLLKASGNPRAEKMPMVGAMPLIYKIMGGLVALFGIILIYMAK